MEGEQIMKFFNILLCLLILFSSCENSKYVFNDGVLKIEVKIKSNDEIGQGIYKLKVFIQVQNLSEEVYQFDLNNMEFNLSTDSSYKVYIDSIASRLITKRKIEPHEVYKENLYLIIQGDNEVELQSINYLSTD